MPIFHNRVYKEVSANGGGLTIYTETVRGLLRHIIVKPATATTTYDFFISDGSSLHLFERESETDELNESVQIPVQSKLVIVVSGSTKDELFKIYLAIQEQ